MRREECKRDNGLDRQAKSKAGSMRKQHGIVHQTREGNVRTRNKKNGRGRRRKERRWRHEW
jgi:hypothetical protein